MPEYLRVIDRSLPDRTMTIVASKFDPQVYDLVEDRPATSTDGSPLPMKPRVPLGTKASKPRGRRRARKAAAPAPTVPSIETSTTSPADQAEPEEEK